jgi:type I restriction enzyme S subunit
MIVIVVMKRFLYLTKILSGRIRPPHHTYLMRDESLVLAEGFRGLILNTSMTKQQLLKLAVGMKVFGVSKSQLKEVLIPFPSKAEQIRITTTLSDMDAEITALETKLEKYRKIKLGMMQTLLTGKIRLV